MGEIVTVVGVLKGITEKPTGWTRIEVNVPGKNYPYWMETKDEDLVAFARGMGTNIATWKYDDWPTNNINPKSGEPYHNHTFLEVVPGGETTDGQQQMSAQTSSQTQSAPAGQEAIPSTFPPLSYGDEKHVIARQTALKAAVQLFEGKAVTTFEDRSGDDVPFAVLKAATFFERWIFRGLPGNESPSSESRTNPAPASGGSGPIPDDDIPFAPSIF